MYIYPNGLTDLTRILKFRNLEWLFFKQSMELNSEKIKKKKKKIVHVVPQNSVLMKLNEVK